MTKVNIVLIDDRCIPVYKTSGSAGADCLSRVDDIIKPGETKIIPLGFKVEIPVGYEIQIRPRSGLATKRRIAILGTIDADYRGEVGAIISNDSDEEFIVHKYDRVAQAVFTPVEQAFYNPVMSLSSTERGDGGFGSTGI